MVAITSIDPTSPKPGDSVTVNLSGATNPTGKTLELGGQSLTLSTQDVSSISLTWPDLHTFGSPAFLRYGQAHTLEVDDAGDVASTTVTTQAKTGFTFGVISALTGIFADDTGLVAGTDEVYGSFITGAGTMSLAGIETLTASPATFRYWVFDISAAQWIGPADEALTAGATAEYPSDPGYKVVRLPGDNHTAVGSSGIPKEANPSTAKANFTLVIEHPFVTETEADALVTTYESQKANVLEITWRGSTYEGKYVGAPLVEQVTGTFYRVRNRLQVVKQ